MPTRRPAITSPASASASPGTCWPCIAIGVRPIAIPTAITPRTRGGIIVEENGGASRKSGVTRASTRMKPASELSASSLSTWVIGPAGRSSALGRAAHQPTIEGIDEYRFTV